MQRVEVYLYATKTLEYIPDSVPQVNTKPGQPCTLAFINCVAIMRCTAKKHKQANQSLPTLKSLENTNGNRVFLHCPLTEVLYVSVDVGKFVSGAH